MLEPDPSSTWALPRCFPTDVCPINYCRTINIDSGFGVVLDCTPDLNETLKISTKPASAAPIFLTGGIDNTVNFYARNGLTLYPDLIFRDVSGGVVDIPSFLVDDPTAVSLINIEGTGSELSTTFVTGKKRIYGAAINIYGNTNFVLQFSGAAFTSVTQTLNVYDTDLNVIDTDAQSTPAPVSGTSYSNIIGIASTGAFFSFFLTFAVNPAAPPAVSSVSVGIASSQYVLSTISTQVYGPSPDIASSLYNSVVSTSSKFSFPLLSVLCTFVGSDLLNGGNIAIGVVPWGYNLSLIPEVAYAQICALGGKHYSGPMKDGVHGFYIPDDVTRIAFYPMDQPIQGRRLCIAILPQSIPSGPSSSATMRVELRSHIEFINPSQTLAHMTCRHGCQEVLDSMFAVLEDENQVGENPDHLKRIAAAAKRVAKDPRTREIAAQALKWIGRGAVAAAPLLLA